MHYSDAADSYPYDQEDEEDRERRVMAHLIEARKRLGVPIRNVSYTSAPHLSLQHRANTCPLPFPRNDLASQDPPVDLLDSLSPPSPPPRSRHRTGSLFPPSPSVQERRSALRASSFNGTGTGSASRRPHMIRSVSDADGNGDGVEYIDEEEHDGASSVFGASSDAASSSLPATVPSLSFSQSSSISIDGEYVEGEDGQDAETGEITLGEVADKWRTGLHISTPPVDESSKQPPSAKVATKSTRRPRTTLAPAVPSLTLKLPDLPCSVHATRSDLIAELGHRDSRSKVLAWTQGWREWEWGCEAQKQQEAQPPLYSLENHRTETVFWAL